MESEKRSFFTRENVLLILIYILTVLSRFMIQGITCNDELQLRMWGQQGLKSFFHQTFIIENIQKGRVLGIIGNLKFLSYISDNIYVFRMMELAFLIAAIALACVFAYKLLKSVHFSVLFGALILAYLPITFEPSAPSAFIIIVTQPLILLLISLITWIDYLDTGKRKYCVTSLIFFLWGMFLYEYIITYVLLFPIIYFEKNVQKGKVRETVVISLKKWLPYLLVTGVYLVLYVSQGFVFPSNYSGNTIGITSISGVLNVLLTECKSSFPGYFLINDKYRYLFQLYNNGKANFQNYTSFVIVVFAVTFLYIFLSSFTKEKVNNRNGISSAVLLLTSAAYTIIPVLPNSLTSLYQGAVPAGFFLSIPVSLNLSFSMVFFLLYLFWIIGEKIRKVIYRFAVAIVALVIAVNVQVVNGVFAEQQFKDYSRITKIEELIRSNYWNCFDNLTVYSPSLYETRNHLAVEPGHWTSYSSIVGNTTQFVSDPSVPAQAALEMQDNNSFYLYGTDFNYLISDKTPDEFVLLRDANKEFYFAHVGDAFWECDGMYYYTLDTVERQCE